ncbi:MAG: DNA-processing protein DprA [Candidatus Gastranaerophilales bacterium]|nr:DNA-processing protein DprA [Candidatus Gastranaerophilales bacterium]
MEKNMEKDMEKDMEGRMLDGMDELEYACACWLCCVSGVGNRTVAALMERFKTARGVYGAGEKELRMLVKEGVLRSVQLEALVESRRKAEPRREYERLRERGIYFLPLRAADYPKRLRRIPDAPCGLFYMGRLPREECLSVAVIGARDCSEYGRYVAAELGKELGRRGVQVISGMARGIDGIGQEAALNAGGMSFGVLGSGVDVCYPAQNRALYERLLCQGGVLSVFAPGTAAKPQLFPPRNRIVSGLADAVVVIEARQKSGTLITVDMALEQGKEVYVVPGRVTDRLSDGCNKLLKQGAGVFLSPEDFLTDMEALSARERNLSWQRLEKDIAEAAAHSVGIGGASVEAAEAQVCADSKGASVETAETRAEENGSAGESALEAVCRVLDLYPQSAGQIADKVSHIQGMETVSMKEVNRLLMQLCVSKRANQVSPGYFQKSACEMFGADRHA